MLRTVVLLAMIIGLAVAEEPYAPQLSTPRLESISKLLKADRAKLNLEREEVQYQEDVHQQTLADLAQIYSPEHADRLQVTYVSFTPENAAKPGDDRGYGLHIVKRLDLPLPNGETKTIYVNEQWPEDKPSKGLLLPDEIRIQTQVRAGARRAKGSEQLYLFDSLRVGWGPHNRDPQLARRTVYRRTNDKNEFKATRSSVSAPFACAGCHQSENRFAENFLARGETRNYEAIVQDSQFKLQPTEMRGYREYIAYLERSGTPAADVQKTKQTLSNPAAASSVPGLLEAIKAISESGDIPWLSDDFPVQTQGLDLVKDQHGVYRDSSGRWWMDALDDVLEGKYVWWEPIPVIP